MDRHRPAWGGGSTESLPHEIINERGRRAFGFTCGLGLPPLHVVKTESPELRRQTSACAAVAAEHQRRPTGLVIGSGVVGAGARRLVTGLDRLPRQREPRLAGRCRRPAAETVINPAHVEKVHAGQLLFTIEPAKYEELPRTTGARSKVTHIGQRAGCAAFRNERHLPRGVISTGNCETSRRASHSRLNTPGL